VLEGVNLLKLQVLMCYEINLYHSIMMLGGYNYIPKTKKFLRHINLDVLCIYNLYYTYRYLARETCFLNST
jgi:hypothetical protein